MANPDPLKVYALQVTATPTSATDAANKAYVDAQVNNLDLKESCDAATTVVSGDIADLAAGAPLTLDGVTLVAGDRVLVKNQTDPIENGIYSVDVAGTGVDGEWSRATDFDEASEVSARAFTYVAEGTVNADTGWGVVSDDDITPGTDANAWTQLSGGGLVDLNAQPTAVVDVAADSIGIIDADAANITAKESIADFVSGIAGTGLTATAGVLTPNPAGIAPEVVDVGADSFVFSDATDSLPKLEAIADLATLMAGRGLVATAGVLAVENLGTVATVTGVLSGGLPIAAETITIGADVYEWDGVGANINVVIAGTAEGSLDNLITAINTLGTEAVTAVKRGTTELILQNAVAAGGALLAGDQSIILAEGTTNFAWDEGNVDMNTVGGAAAGSSDAAFGEFIATAAMISNGHKVGLTFTPTFVEFYAHNSGDKRSMTGDTVTFDGALNLLLFAFGGGAAPETQANDVVRWRAWS